jgi:hypothetical protein
VSYTQNQQGSFANGSYTFGTWSYAATDTSNTASAQTLTLSETLQASGSLSDGFLETYFAQVQSGSGTPATINAFNGSSHSVSFSGTLSTAETVTLSQAGTFTESVNLSGSFSGGSFAYSAMTYSLLSTGSTSSTDASACTVNDAVSAYQSQTSSHTGGDSGDNASDSSSSSFSQQETLSNSNTVTRQSSNTYALYEQGSYSAQSWSLSSFNLSEQDYTSNSRCRDSDQEARPLPRQGSSADGDCLPDDGPSWC